MTDLPIIPCINPFCSRLMETYSYCSIECMEKGKEINKTLNHPDTISSNDTNHQDIVGTNEDKICTYKECKNKTINSWSNVCNKHTMYKPNVEVLC